MTEAVLSKAQAPEMGYLRRVHAVTLRGKVCSCEIRKTLNDEPLLQEVLYLLWFGYASRMSQGRKDWRSKSCWLHPRGSRQRLSKDQLAQLHLRPHLVPPWCEASRTTWDCCWSWDIESPPTAAAHATLL